MATTEKKAMQATNQTRGGKGSGALYQRVADDIRRQIEGGELRPGERLPAFPDLCRQYGVSNITIRGALRSLAESGLIASEERRGIFVASRKPSTKVIGCYGFASNMRHLPYYIHLFRGIQRRAEREQYEILLLDLKVPSITWEKIDAVILAVAEDATGHLSLPPGMCAVSMLHRHQAIPSVVADDGSGMGQAVEYLHRCGHRRIGYLHDDAVLSPIRVAGYRAALRRVGIKPLASWEHNLMSHHEEEFRGRGRETMREWLQNGWKKAGITALICQNDRTAIGVLQALRESGIEVPGDLSLVGFDSTDECELVTPRLASVRVPLEEMGEKAADLLFEMMQKEHSDPLDLVQHITLMTSIDERESVRKV
jgi:GntR family transcriptional regulator of arabinose operon